MSDDGSSSDVDELHDIVAEYEEKAKLNKESTEVKEERKTMSTEEEVQVSTKPSQSGPIEVPMDKLLFGDKSGLIKRLAKAVGSKVPDEEVEEEKDVNDGNEKTKKRKPVWTDADDETLVVGEVKRLATSAEAPRKDKSYKEYLTARFARLQSQPKWASLDSKPKTEGDSDDEELLRTVGFLAKRSKSVLPSHNIQCKPLKDLNRATYAETDITSIEFHPTSTAALISSDSGLATIYGIDGQKNEKLHNMFFQNYPIKCARITPCGTKAIFGSIRRFYYSYDLLTAQEQRFKLPTDVTALKRFELSPCGRYMAVAGRFGELHLFHAKSHELLHTFKQEDKVAGLCFTSNSQQIICNSKSNTVNIFSLRQQRLEHSFIDDGCIKGNVLDLSPNQCMLATGSMEGAVNVYNFNTVLQSKTPKPEKIFLNLTTAISHVKFNHSSELLAFCSVLAPTAVKLAHFPSATVYANFPPFSAELGKVRNMNFSPNSGYLALGAKKKAPLYRLKYFNNY